MEKIIINTQEDFINKAYKNQGKYIHNYNLKNAQVNCDIEFIDYPSQHHKTSFNFFDVEFNKSLKFSESNKRIKNLIIENCIFKSRINIQYRHFENCLIMDSTFKKEVDFSNTTFKNETHFIMNEFFSNIYFSESKFHYLLKMTGNYFYGEVSFLKSKFDDDSDFSDSEFRKGISFNESIFQDRFFWKNIPSQTNIADFSGVTFSGEAFLTQSHFYGGISLYGSIIKEHFDLTDIVVYGDNSDYETLRIIKNLFLKQNNRIEVLKFHEKELDAHRKTLKLMYDLSKKSYLKFKKIRQDKPKAINNKNAIIHDVNSFVNSEHDEYKEYKKNFKRDWLILTFNKWSNNYGLSWVQGLKFILTSSIIFYSLYVITLIIQGNYPYDFGWNNWTEFWNGTDYTLKYYLQFLIPTHKFNFMIGAKTSFISHLIDFISRIVIGYGIYQMVQAFRKFGKI